jgi:hypothetical protein
LDRVFYYTNWGDVNFHGVLLIIMVASKENLQGIFTPPGYELTISVNYNSQYTLYIPSWQKL